VRVAVYGAGSVGLVIAATMAEIGHEVVCTDADVDRIESLRKHELPIHEPHLYEQIQEFQKVGALSFTNSAAAAAAWGSVFFVCVDTPSREDGSCDLGHVYAAIDEIVQYAPSDTVVAITSTVPVGTCKKLQARINEKTPSRIDVVFNPEFLREGSAVADAMKPERIVIGSRNWHAQEVMMRVYSPLDAPIMNTDLASAELIKLASNAFLAAKISFVNALTDFSEVKGADIGEVARGMGLDKRIGDQFLQAGIGWGGSCLPKDLRALIHDLDSCHCDSWLLRGVQSVNTRQLENFAQRLDWELGGLNNMKVAVLGLAFKQGTDDVRESPALALIDLLLERGADVAAHDPVAIASARKAHPLPNYVSDPYIAADGADALVICTDWPEYKSLDWKRIRDAMCSEPVIFDGRNMFDPLEMKSLGFNYRCVGR
jgi:UDPglucose 6-dehydrogenase